MWIWGVISIGFEKTWPVNSLSCLWTILMEFWNPPLVQRPFRFWFWWTRLKPFEIHSRIYTKFLQSNEIYIRGPLFSKIHQRALSMLKNASNQKTNTTLKNQLFKIYNFVACPKKIRSLLRFLNCTLSLLSMAQPRYETLHVQRSISRLSHA